eukprot:jgi/Psemu1/291589/fgenesh1_pg.752_\
MASIQFQFVRFSPLLLVGVLCFLLPSEILGRVGSTASITNVLDEERIIVPKRSLAGKYGTNSNPGRHYGSYEPQEKVYFKPITISNSKHHGHYNYYYIKGPVDDPRKTAEPTRKPTAKPTPQPNPVEPNPVPPTGNSLPVSSPGKANPALTDKPVDAVPETLAPTASTTNAPTEQPTQDTEVATASPTAGPEVSTPAPTAGFLTNLTVDGDGNDDQQFTIEFEPPSKVQLRILDFALEGGVEFEDPSSYQSAALRRVEEQVGIDDMTDVKLMQYYSLYCIFEATNAKSNEFIVQSKAFEAGIPGWKVTTGWTENNVDPCGGKWWGISCVDDKVVNLDLFDNSLTGNFPPEVVFLAADGIYSIGAGALVSLDIFNNNFMSNNRDNSWMQDLGSQLGFLYVQNTLFSGKLPKKFPEGLIELDIANSMITGSLEGAAFEGLNSLRFLLMDGVQFNSSIPSEIANLPSLEYLFATDAMITGDLGYMESMSVIFEHWTDRNPDLGGTIPSFLGDLTTLQSFSIAECAFTGTIPESLGNLELMQQMWLYGNQLIGEIPASLGDLKFMRIFEVAGNNLSDSMPQRVCDNFQEGMLEVLGADCDRLDRGYFN